MLSPVVDVMRVVCWASFHSAQPTRAALFSRLRHGGINLSLGPFDSLAISNHFFTIGRNNMGRPEPASRDKSSGRYKSDSGCFIATAVYGDFDAPEVVSLRNWRDQVLSTTIAGRAFISAYYFISPPIARYLTCSPWLSSQTRKFLDAFIRRHG